MSQISSFAKLMTLGSNVFERLTVDVRGGEREDGPQIEPTTMFTYAEEWGGH